MAINIDHTKHLISPNASTTIKFDTTGSIVIPAGTQSQRPGTAAAGALRFNTQANAGDGGVEYYDGTAWQLLLSGGTFTSFSTIAVAGQDSLTADSSTDTLTFAEGTGITITTTEGSDTLTITLDASIDDLTDVDTTSVAPTSGQALLWNSTTSKWEPGDVSVANALDDLTDVALTTPAADQVLKYDGTNWINSTVSLEELDDVDIATPITNGFVLTWDSVDAKWKPTAPGGGGGGGGATYIDDLLDVETDGINTPSNGQALRWDATQGIWKPSSGAYDTEIAVFTYTGDGTTNSFSFAPNSVTSDEDLLVTINGLLQDPGTDYNISGTNVVFTDVPVLSDIVNIRVIRTAGAQLAVTVSEIDSLGNVYDVTTNVTALRFDQDSGFDVEDLGGGEVKIMMNSTFKTWKVDGQDDLVATGLDTIEFVQGTGIVITTNITADPKQIEFALDAGLDDLTDVDLTTPPTAGQVLSWNGTSWVADDQSGGATDLDGLSDVAITTPTVGQVLKYNGTNWINDTDSAGGGALADLTDVEITGTPSNGQVLKYSSTLGKWVPGTDNTGSGGGGGATATLLDTITPDGVLDTFDLELSGSPYTPQSAENLIVTINGVYQIPYQAYDVTGDQITFAEALESDDLVCIVEMGTGGGGGGLSSITVKENGTTVGSATALNFVGADVTVSSGTATITITGGGAGVAATLYRYSISSTTDTLSGPDDDANTLAYTAGDLSVFLNGIRLKDGDDYTATNGTSIVFSADLLNGDYVEIESYGAAGTDISTASIDELADVRTSGAYAPTNGQALVWNASASQWEPGTVSGGGGGSIDITRYQYTTTGTTTTVSGPDNNTNTLSYTSDNLNVYLNGIRLSYGNDYTATSGSSVVLAVAVGAGNIIEIDTWEEGTGGGGGGASDLDDLTDVVITTPSNGQVLKYNGTSWVNAADATGSSLASIDDIPGVNITSATSGQVLYYDGTNWINSEFSGLHSADTTVYFTTTTTVDTFSKTTYRSAKYLLQATTGTDYHVTEVVLLHDDTNVYISEYGTLFTDVSLITVTADISGTDVRLRVTPVGAPTSVKLKRIDIEV